MLWLNSSTQAMKNSRLLLLSFLVLFALLCYMKLFSGARSHSVRSTDTYLTRTRTGQTLKSIENYNALAPEKWTYVVTYYYVGQQGAGARGIASLQCFLGSMKQSFKMVEPYIENSYFRGYTSAPREERLMFSDVFNFDHFNSASKGGGRVQMTTHDHFVQHSPNYVILVNAHWKLKKRRVLLKAGKGHEKTECIEDERIDRLLINNKKLKNEPSLFLKNMKQRSRVCVVVILELPLGSKHNTFESHSVNSLEEFIFQGWQPHEVVLVFSHWAGPFHVPIHEFSNKLSCKFEFNTTITKDLFKPSTRLLRDAQRYEDMFLGKQSRLAIMLRVEKIVKFYLDEPEHVNKPNSIWECFQEVIDLSNKMGNGTILKPLVTMDVGKFGSGTFHDHNQVLTKLSERTLRTLYHDRWSVVEWESSFVEAAGGLSNKAYIAALQRTLASRADCLLMMGGGNFQTLAMESYLDYHGNKSERCLQLVCGLAQGSHLVSRLINNGP